MKLGIYLNSQHPDGEDPARRFSEMIEQVRLMRQLGFDSVWSGEHHATDGYHYFPLLSALNRLAAEAEGMSIGTNIVLLPLHNPMELAEIGAFLDVQSGGKFMLGVGLGYRPEEFAMFGVSMKERTTRLAEGVEIIRRLWSEDNVTHKGKHWRFENLTVRPRPSQRPRPPIIVAAQVDAAIERAAKIGDGWCIVPTTGIGEVSKQADFFRQTRAGAGLAPSQHLVRLFEVSCAADEETALRRAAPFLLAKYSAYVSWGLPGLKLDTTARPEEQLRGLAKNRFGVGTPAQVVDALMAQHAAGITHVTMRISWPGMEQADILAGIELLGRQVLPEVRRRTSAA